MLIMDDENAQAAPLAPIVAAVTDGVMPAPGDGLNAAALTRNKVTMNWGGSLNTTLARYTEYIFRRSLAGTLLPKMANSPARSRGTGI
ncbi:MAG: hypothetical protein R2911_00605 [Caldilineaceae bacterium]